MRQSAYEPDGLNGLYSSPEMFTFCLPFHGLLRQPRNAQLASVLRPSAVERIA